MEKCLRFPRKKNRLVRNLARNYIKRKQNKILTLREQNSCLARGNLESVDQQIDGRTHAVHTIPLKKPKSLISKDDWISFMLFRFSTSL